MSSAANLPPIDNFLGEAIERPTPKEPIVLPTDAISSQIPLRADTKVEREHKRLQHL